jgi:hypothetical protein
MPVIPDNLLFLPCLLFSHLFQPLRGAETVVGFSLSDQLLHIFPVEFDPLRLHIRAAVSFPAGAFIPLNPQPLEGTDEILHGLFAVPGLVGILHPENELSSLRAGKKIVE